MDSLDQYFHVLGLKPGASKEEITEAYRILIKTWYPQRTNEDQIMRMIAKEKLKEIEEAYIKLVQSFHGSNKEESLTLSSQLEIRSEPPGAAVFLNGKEVGESPLVLSDVQAGQYLIRVVKDGYNPSEGRVVIKPGHRKVVNAHLNKIVMERGALVQTDPIGAMVYLDGKPVGTSPCEVRSLTSGSHELKIIKEGYKTWKETITIEPGKRSDLNIELKKRGLRPGEVLKDPYWGIEFVFVKGGRFEMGDVFGDGNREEKPVHEVHVDDFWMGKFLVTQAQWQKVIGSNPSRFKSGHDYPVEEVSWYDVQGFFNILNEKTNMKYRLPTEAEWEYAARSGGKREKWAGTNSESEIDEYAWCWINSLGKTHPVGKKKPNTLGLYDMCGNVWEWVQDWYDKDYYKNSPPDNPQRSSFGEYKVVFRGGSWESQPENLRTTGRHSTHPLAASGIGFRLVLSAKDTLGLVTESHSTKLKDTNRSVTGPLVSQPDFTNSEAKSYITLQQTAHKEEGPADSQSERPPQRGLGVGAKVGLTVMVVLIGGMTFGLLRDIVGHGQYIVAGIEVLILWYIWSRPGRK